MPKPAITHANFAIERSYPVPPSQTFAAFADPETKRRWMSGDRAMTEGLFSMDFRVGGTEVREYRSTGGPLPPGTAIRNDTVYQDIVPDERIVFAYTMTVGDYRISASLATVELFPEGQGTRLVFTEQGAFFEHADGEAIRKQGWTSLLASLETELTQHSALTR